MTHTTANTIRANTDHWDRIEKVTADRKLTANQNNIEFTAEALERHVLPQTDTATNIPEASTFDILIPERDLITTVRNAEVERLNRLILTRLPELDSQSWSVRFPEASNRWTTCKICLDSLGEEHTSQTERMFPSVNFFSLLKRDGNVHDGQREKIKRVRRDTLKTQDSICDKAQIRIEKEE